MNEPKNFILIGMVSGLSMQEGIKQLSLDKARIFRNPAAVKQPGEAPEIGANTTIYEGEGKERHFVKEVATYLIESEVEASSGILGHVRIQGSGAVTIKEDGISLSTGKEPHSQASVAIPFGATFNTPLLMQTVFEDAILPLRLLTKGRILVYPATILAEERREECEKSGLDVSCPELPGESMKVELLKDDCGEIQAFSKSLATADLRDFEVPMLLFSRSFYKADLADRALDLVIALESLLSGSSESIGYKLAFRACCLTAKDEDRWATFSFVKKAYGYRSTLVHGTKKKLEEARSELSNEIIKIEDIVRRLLWLACMLQLEPFQLNSGRSASMRDENSIDEYILTHILGKKSKTPVDSYSQVGKLGKFSRLF